MHVIVCYLVKNCIFESGSLQVKPKARVKSDRIPETQPVRLLICMNGN